MKIGPRWKRGSRKSIAAWQNWKKTSKPWTTPARAGRRTGGTGQGRAEYESQKADAEQQLADAQQELDDARQEIEDIEDAEWYVLDRGANAGYVSFKNDANRMDALSTVFPVIFFLVAALVALTTMTRMVEEERVIIGTYKALGYTKGRIAFKYLFYAGAATLAGCIIGPIIGFKLLPWWYGMPIVLFTLGQI